MKSALYILSVVIFASISACEPQRQSSEPGTTDTTERITAVAQLQPASGSQVQGTATFVQLDNGVRMTLELSGLKPNGIHALHLHEFGDCSAPDATSAGDHWNPTSDKHGDRHGNDEFHRGDIDNIEADGEGNANYEITVEDWTIGGDAATDIIGKSVIVHLDEDDFVSQPSGDAGDRITCGVIARQ